MSEKARVRMDPCTKKLYEKSQSNDPRCENAWHSRTNLWHAQRTAIFSACVFPQCFAESESQSQRSAELSHTQLEPAQVINYYFDVTNKFMWLKYDVQFKTSTKQTYEKPINLLI